MDKPKRKNYFFKLLAILFLLYVSLLIAYESGYYETKARNRATLTKEAMQEFESDLQSGKVVDIKDYLKEEKIDYSNKVTKIGNRVSKSLSDFMTKGLKGAFNALKGLFW